MRARTTIRAWEYRQRKHSKGVWFRLRRVLSDAESAFSIPCSEAGRLEGEGCIREPVGAEIEPPKIMLFVRAEQLDQITGKRRLHVSLNEELLAAPCVALTYFRSAEMPLAGDDSRKARD